MSRFVAHFCIGLFSLAGGVALAQDQKSLHVDIAAQPVGDALNQFAEQSGLQVVLYADDAEGIEVVAVAGEFDDASLALERLLASTGLEYTFINDRTVAVIAANEDEAEGPGNGRTTPRSRMMVPQASWMKQSQSNEEIQENQERESQVSSQKPKRQLEEIVVTGSRIRGIGVSAGSRVEIIDREEIDRSGLATVEQIVQSQPQTFRGGPNGGTRLGTAASSNAILSSGSSLNLRGLGSTSTLTLVNGRRIPIAGLDGNFYDVSNVPMTAIDRIEVLPDSASAIYGADAIAGVVNVILREDWEGAETRLRYGSVTEGEMDELLLGQVFGKSWKNGNALISYEYYNRENLANADRDFAANSDLRAVGGDNFSFHNSNPANILDPATNEPVFAIPMGQNGTNLSPDDLLPGVVNFQNENAGRDLFPDQKRHGAFLSVSQEISHKIDLFAEGRYNRREFKNRASATTTTLLVPSSNPFFVDPFGDSDFVLVSYSFLQDLGHQVVQGEVEGYDAAIGGDVRLGESWRAQLYGSYGAEDTQNVLDNFVDELAALPAALADPDPATAFNPFGDGSHTNPETVDSIRATVERAVGSRVRSANLVADGPIFNLRSGPVRIAVGGDYRLESFDSSSISPFGTSQTNLRRTVLAAFAELFVPVFGDEHRLPGLERLAFSIAARTETYRDERNIDAGDIRRRASTTNPKLGLLWSPVDGVSIRSTWGTSFKAPDMPTLGAANVAFLTTFVDPLSPTGSTLGLALSGTDPDLDNETATTWTLGADIEPAVVSGLRVGMTYFNIEFEDRIARPDVFSTILTEEERFASAITRNPDQSLVNEICNSESFSGDPVICEVAPIGVIVDARAQNVAVTEVTGFDLTISQTLDSQNLGRFAVTFNGSYLFDFEEAFGDDAPLTDLVNTINRPVGLRMRNSLTWSNRGSVSATTFLNYADSYTDNLSEPARGIGSWTTLDLTLSVDTEQRFRAIGLNDTKFDLSVLNLFDRDPPFANNRTALVAYDPENATPLGRFISLNFTKRW